MIEHSAGSNNLQVRDCCSVGSTRYSLSVVALEWVLCSLACCCLCRQFVDRRHCNRTPSAIPSLIGVKLIRSSEAMTPFESMRATSLVRRYGRNGQCYPPIAIGCASEVLGYVHIAIERSASSNNLQVRDCCSVGSTPYSLLVVTLEWVLCSLACCCLCRQIVDPRHCNITPYAIPSLIGVKLIQSSEPMTKFESTSATSLVRQYGRNGRSYPPLVIGCAS